VELHRPFRVVCAGLDGDILAALARADEAFTPPQLHRVVGAHSEDGIRRALRRLADQGIVRSRQVGRAFVYELNRQHLAAGPVVELANLGATFLTRTREVLDGWRVPPAYVALFGSAARGEMRPDSDLDVFVVRAAAVDADDAVWVGQLGELTEQLSAWTGNDTRILEYDVAELGAVDPVLDEIAAQGIPLGGDAAVLARRPRRADPRPRRASRRTARSAGR
jgi:predicted nucleotidyltransferase